MAKILLMLWGLLFVVQLIGAKSDYAAKAVIIVTALIFAVNFKARWSLASKIEKWLQTHIKTWHVAAFIAITISAQITALIVDYEALNGTMWDLAMYIQITYSQATTGLQQFTFPGTVPVQSHYEIHRSLSVYIVGLLYKLTQSPWVVLLWQGFFLFAPGLVALLWYRAVTKTEKLPTYAYGYALAFLCWASSPTVLRMEVWPYVFYMMGFTLLALAYLFYYQKKWLLWFIAVVALAYEKEDFGVITAAFGVLVLLESFATIVKRRGSKAARADFLPMSLGIAASYIGIHSLVSFHAEHASVVTFASRFGDFGATPGEVITTIFTRPLVTLKALTRPATLQYLLFFVTASLIWLVPRWRVFKFLIPVSPVLGANAIASYTTMQNLKDPYALPIMTGVAATVVLGAFPAARKRAPIVLLVGALVPLFWGHQSPVRTLKERVALFKTRSADRQALEELRQDKELVICCEERLCSYLADRPYFIQADRCKDAALMKKLEGRTAVYVVYASTLHHYDVKWAKTTPFLKISEPTHLSRKTQP